MKWLFTSIAALLIGATVLAPVEAHGFAYVAPNSSALALAELEAEQLALANEAAALAAAGTPTVVVQHQFIGLRNRIALNRLRRAQIRAQIRTLRAVPRVRVFTPSFFFAF